VKGKTVAWAGDRNTLGNIWIQDCADVIDGPQSVVLDDAENRLHAQKALMEYLLLGNIDR
jgi:ornithine carbamoyltransferase